MKIENPLISIITVSFNSAKTIEKTILSVLNQTYKNIEYIIIDGRSTDGAVEIIKKYNDRIFYWVSEKDNGISDAFNKGITASHGEIIGIINSDDWYESDTIETIVNLDSINNVDFYVGALRFWRNENQNEIIYPDIKYKKKILYYMPHLNHPASFFKKDVYNEVGLFNTKYKYAMDYDLFLRAHLNNKKGIFTNKILSNMLTGGISNIQTKKVCKEVLLISENKTMGFVWYIIFMIRRNIKNIIIVLGGYRLLFFIKSHLFSKK